jgi:hypothetical protein
VEELQEILGRANDSYVATQRIQALQEQLCADRPQLWRSWQRGVEAFLQWHHQRRLREHRLFCRSWRRWQTSGLLEEFKSLVRAPAPSNRKKKD